MRRLRSATQEDMPFILSSWIRSQRQEGHHAYMVDGVYFPYIRSSIERRMHGATLTVCCTDDDDQIVGWSCAGGGKFHYLYVKHAFRRWGVAKLLACAHPQVTVCTSACRLSHVVNRSLNLRYEPL
jgi:hypothetical protein